MTKNKKSKTVYIGLSADLIHQGHLNIIAEGCKLGKVIVGLLTDEAIASYHKVLSLKPDFAEAHTNMGYSLQKLGKYNEDISS